MTMSQIEQDNFDELGFDDVKRVIKERKEKYDTSMFRRDERRIYLGSIVSAFFVIVLVYFLLPVSHVKAVSVSGNSYLDTGYIKEISKVTDRSRFYLCFPAFIKNRILENELIEECNVKMGQNHTIEISVKEKELLGYIYDDEPYIVTKNGSLVSLDSTNVSVISRIPLITGYYDTEQRNRLISALQSIHPEVIEQIAEINRYSLSYDPYGIRVLMRSGVYYVGSYDNLKEMNYFNRIYARLSEKSYCVFGTDTNVAYSAVCPWNRENLEYWIGSDGNPVRNSAGEYAVKHYYLYVDSIGNRVKDSYGNLIPIPLNEHGDEVVDINFKKNFEEGYYATGVLVIPEDAE